MTSNFEELRSDLVDLTIEMERDDYHNDLVSFDAYKEKTKAEALQGWDNYFSRLKNGYEILINEISKDIDGKKLKSPMIIKP